MKINVKGAGLQLDGNASVEGGLDVSVKVTAPAGEIQALAGAALNFAAGKLGRLSSGGGSSGDAAADSKVLYDGEEVLTFANIPETKLTVNLLGDVTGNGFVTIDHKGEKVLNLNTIVAGGTANGTVTSFNGRQGAVMLSNTDVITALGYTPSAPGVAANAMYSENANNATSALLANNATFFGGQTPAFYLSATNMTGTVPAARLTGTYAISITGNAATADNATFATNAGSANLAANALYATTANNSNYAGRLNTARVITLSGDVTGNVAFDGSGNVTLTTTVASTPGVANSATYFGGQLPAYYTNIAARLGYTPVQQGTGVGQNTNAVKIGWSAESRLKVTVDSTDLGFVVFDSQLSSAIVAGANNASFLNGQAPAYYNDLTNATGILPAARLSGTYAITANNTAYFNGQVASYYTNLTNATGTLPAARLPAFTGDVSSTVGTSVLTLPIVNANVGSFGTATAAPTFTVDAKGRVTAAGSVTITPAFGSVTGKPTTLAGYGITDAPLRAPNASNGESTVIASDIRNTIDPSVSVGYMKGVRFRFGSLNDDGTGPYADVIDMATYQDAGGGGYNSLYFNKAAQAIQHKYGAAGATAWTTKTIAYTDSALTGSTTGSAATLTTGRTIAMTGDVSWTSPAFNGSGNVTAAGTLATVNANVGSFGSATATPTFTVDAKGRLTAAGSVTIAPAFSSVTGKPTTLAGYGITNGQTALGYTPVQQGTGIGQTASVVKLGWDGVGRLKATVDTSDIGNIVFDSTLTSASVNYATSAGKWNTARTINLTGDVSGSIVVDGSGNVNTSITVLSASGATANNASYLGGQLGSYYTNLANATGTLAAARLPAFTGDATTVAGASAITLATVNANVGSFGSATAAPTFTVDAKGRLTAAGSVTVTPAWGSITGKPTTISGYGITNGAVKDATNTFAASQAFSAGITVSNGAAQYPTMATFMPSTHATSRRVGVALDAWLLLQDTGGNGTKDFALYNTAGGGYAFSVGTNNVVNGLNMLSPAVVTGGQLRLQNGVNANQIFFGYSADNYIHRITTTHNGGAQAGNAFQFAVWDLAADAINGVGGTRRVAEFDYTAINFYSTQGAIFHNGNGLYNDQYGARKIATADPNIGTGGVWVVDGAGMYIARSGGARKIWDDANFTPGDYVNRATTGLGLTGNQSVNTGTTTAAQWSALPVGYSRMTKGTTATGMPNAGYGYFTKTANRDNSGGWGGLWVGRTGEDSYFGYAEASTDFATWHKIWTSNNMAPPAVIAAAGTLAQRGSDGSLQVNTLYSTTGFFNNIFASGGGNVIRMKTNGRDDINGRAAMHYIDGSTYYLMLTNNGDSNGNYNAFRPFYVDLASARAYMGQGLTVYNDFYSANNTRLGNVNIGGGEAFLYESATNYLGLRVGPSTAYRYYAFDADTIRYNGNKLWHAANDGTGSGLDADYLRGISGDDYLTRTTAQGIVSSAVKRFYSDDYAIQNTGGENAALQVIGANTTADAFMSFHRPGAFACQFGLGADNNFRYGGWSYGVNTYRLWSEANDGINSGLDADMVRGYYPTTGNNGNSLALRDVYGSLMSTCYNTVAGDGNGIRLWNGDVSYSICMSAAGNADHGGRRDASSDYNMYFKMSGGTNRGFVFKNGSTVVAQIEGVGNFRVASELYVSGWTRILGSFGLYWESFGGGWNMTDSTYMRAYGDKHLYSGGNATFNGTVTMGAFTVTSDRRLKKDFTSIDNAGWIIDNTNVYEFTKNNKRMFGMIAQEAREIVPTLVEEVADPDNKYGDDPLLGLDQTGYIPVLMQEVKDLRKREQERDALLAELMNEIRELKGLRH